jgi:5-methylcytosine-specific restriction enzyme A
MSAAYGIGMAEAMIESEQTMTEAAADPGCRMLALLAVIRAAWTVTEPQMPLADFLAVLGGSGAPAIPSPRKSMPRRNPPRSSGEASFSDFYRSQAWRQFRAMVIRERGLICEDKLHEAGKPMINIDLDHIDELSDGGAKLNRSNVLLRCRSCHVRKSQAEKRRRLEKEFWERRSRLTGGS